MPARRDERMAQRIRAVRRRPWLLRATIGTAAAVVVGLTWLVGFSSVFAVTEVTYSGAPEPLLREAREAAPVPMGTPLVRLDTDAIARSLSATHQYESVVVSRSWPHTVIVRLTPKKPYAVWENAEGQLKVVDRDGLAYRAVASRPAGLPVIRSATAEQHPEHLVAAVQAIAGRPASVSKPVTRVVVDSMGRVTFMVGTTRVIWGDGTRVDKKWAVLEAMLAQKDIVPEGATINLSAPDDPVVAGGSTSTRT